MDRRDFLMATTAAMLTVPGRAPSAQPSTPAGPPPDLANSAAGMTGGRLTARGLTQVYLDRIEALDRHGPTLRAVLETNPRALDIAAALDEERLAHGPRGPLHGVPILIKDNVETSDRMMTTAGSDRKSTRLNSSHLVISYAVFCLKKKKKTIQYRTLAYDSHTPPCHTVA